MIIKEGAVMNIYNQKIKKRLNESIAECALLNISLLKDKFGSVNKTIISNVDMNAKFNDYKFMLPIKGDKRKLLELSLSNINQYINNEKKKAILLNSKNHQKRILGDHPKRFQAKNHTTSHGMLRQFTISKVQMLFLHAWSLRKENLQKKITDTSM